MPIIIIVVVMLLHDAAGTLVQNEVGLAGYLIVRGVNGYHHLNFVGTFDKCPVRAHHHGCCHMYFCCTWHSSSS